MSQFNIDEIEKRTLSGLKDFQRATVERVDYLFRHNQNRVLVADEVGMGKTLIARGAIVKTARLRIEEKDDLFEALKEKAFTGGAEKYLWIPPSLPYYEMQGAYKNSKVQFTRDYTG